MTRYLKVAFCLFVLFGAATLAGCSETGKAKPAEKPAATDASKTTAEGSESKN
jgi:hypothetical protein